MQGLNSCPQCACSRGLDSDGRGPTNPTLLGAAGAVLPALLAAQTAASSALRLGGFAFRMSILLSPRRDANRGVDQDWSSSCIATEASGSNLEPQSYGPHLDQTGR